MVLFVAQPGKPRTAAKVKAKSETKSIAKSISCAERPASGELLLNIKLKLLNGADTGATGAPWALDRVARGSLKLWRRRNNVLAFRMRITGDWNTLKGVPSPVAGTPQEFDGRGTFFNVIDGTVESATLLPYSKYVIVDDGYSFQALLEGKVPQPTGFFQRVLGASGVVVTGFTGVYYYRNEPVWTSVVVGDEETNVGDVITTGSPYKDEDSDFASKKVLKAKKGLKTKDAAKRTGKAAKLKKTPVAV